MKNHCPNCGGTLEHKTITHKEHDNAGSFFIVENVPALVCRQCGAIYLYGHVDKMLDDLIENTQPKKKIETPVYDFDKVQA